MTFEQIQKIVELAPEKDRALLIQTLTEKLLYAEKQNGFKKTNIVYNNKQTGEAIRSIVDEMIATEQDYEFNYTDYPNHSPNTVRLKVNGGVTWLVENEPEKYAEWRTKVLLCRRTHAFVMLWRKEGHEYVVTEDNELKARPITEQELKERKKNTKNKLDWKEKLFSWIEGTDKFLNLTGLALTDEDIKFINTICCEPDFTVKVKNNEIRILRGTLE